MKKFKLKKLICILIITLITINCYACAKTKKDNFIHDLKKVDNYYIQVMNINDTIWGFDTRKLTINIKIQNIFKSNMVGTVISIEGFYFHFLNRKMIYEITLTKENDETETPLQIMTPYNVDILEPNTTKNYNLNILYTNFAIDYNNYKNNDFELYFMKTRI